MRTLLYSITSRFCCNEVPLLNSTNKYFHTFEITSNLAAMSANKHTVLFVTLKLPGLGGIGADVGAGVGVTGCVDIVGEGETVILRDGVTVILRDGVTVILWDGVTVILWDGVTVILWDGVTVMLWWEVTVTLWEGVNVMWEGVKVLVCRGLIVMVAVLFTTIEDDPFFGTTGKWFCVALPFAITAGLEAITLFPLISSTKTTTKKWQKAKYIEDITWRLGDTKFLFSCWKIFHSFAELTREIFFQHEKRTFISPSHHVMLYLLCKHQWNTKSFHFNSF